MSGRGGRRAGAGVKKGDKRGTYSKTAATKKKSTPSEASKAMLASFVACGSDNCAPQDGHDGDPPAAPLEVDDKCKVPANAVPSAQRVVAAGVQLQALDHDYMHMGGGEGA